MLELLPNTNLSHYRILKKLGAGGMGEVYLAEDTRLRRKIALKVLPENIAGDKERLRRFEQEAFAASALNHPNILTIHEFGADGDAHFLATEFIEGETLREKLNRDELTLKKSVEIAEQIAFALSAAHAAGIVHRDIKPENVMLRSDGIVKVLDFGLAKLTENKAVNPDSEAETRALVQTNPGVVMGTVAYMSPEQARGKDTDARTDIFSLGVVLYEMLTKKMPFGGETISDVIASILKTEPPPPGKFNQETPAELERIVCKSLAKDREERYQTAKDLLVDLRRLRKQLELTAEIERTQPPDKLTDTQQENATQTLTAQPTSSAEYVFREVRRHKLGFVVGSLILLLAVGGLGFWYFVNRSANTKQIESIAVLPFVNETGNVDAEYLSDGMTETLINSLSQLPYLSVKARSSVFRYKGKEAEPVQIGNELNVQAVLNGRVVQRGQDLILYLSLVDARTGNQIWGEQYNRRQADLIQLQTEVARDVSGKLKTKLSGADEQRLAKNYTQNAEAYQLYLRGRFYWNKRTVKDIRKSIEYFQQAVALDPNYTLAYAGLADAHTVLPTYGGASSREVMPKAREAALKALSLDDQLAESHISLGLILNYYDYDFAGAEREFRRAIELDPNSAAAHQFYGNLHIHLGRFKEAYSELERALELEPLSPLINRFYGLALLYDRRYDQSAARLKKALELDAGFVPAYDTLANVYRAQGKHADSVETFADAEEALGNHEAAAVMREIFAKGGWQNFLRAMIEQPQLNYRKSRYIVATYHAELGEKDKAFAELNKAYEDREFFMIVLKVDQRFDALRDDPRFQDLLRKIGFQ
jgi:eukaryotic-like serine/threonine-protein kinase